jgi:hypothetical protein
VRARRECMCMCLCVSMCVCVCVCVCVGVGVGVGVWVWVWVCGWVRGVRSRRVCFGKGSTQSERGESLCSMDTGCHMASSRLAGSTGVLSPDLCFRRVVGVREEQRAPAPAMFMRNQLAGDGRWCDHSLKALCEGRSLSVSATLARPTCSVSR